MGFLVVLFLVGVVVGVIAWRVTRRAAPFPGALVRAAAIALCAPTIAPAPDLHGALVIPAWAMVLGGPAEIGLANTMTMLLFPAGVVFAVLFLWFWYRLSARSDTP